MSDRIRVCGEDHQCFYVAAETLEPESCGSYDPYCWTDPLPGPQIHVNEWNVRRNALRTAQGQSK